ncbi:MAG: ribbon-helix-helix protein, CopG family [Chloroflexi bacterium]|nr:ribbon-helix-helix protein, CopG family [Chloroflexota bacterium]MCI0788929.1 ribbon-helix-helix protein, CopG family [Chloroflexota bacterium]MCI0811857.1 ribbon-helix-helix protein, CopG family [Chloroflexota bacterium]MCI0898957.1 ribbon-helix-helix protein, CopG family [Chloroflexota bacterium]
MRTHVILPEDLVRSVDALAGKGKRSQFIEEAIREKVRIDTLRAALEATAGILSAEDHPEWATSEKVASWVRESRKQSDKRIDTYLRG